MIEGIDYYPKQRKNNPNFKYWALSLALVLLITYWIFSDKQNLETSGSNIIIISEPQIEPIAITPSVKPTKIKVSAPKILENLDELLQNQTNKKP